MNNKDKKNIFSQSATHLWIALIGSMMCVVSCPFVAYLGGHAHFAGLREWMLAFEVLVFCLVIYCISRISGSMTHYGKGVSSGWSKIISGMLGACLCLSAIISIITYDWGLRSQILCNLDTKKICAWSEEIGMLPDILAVAIKPEDRPLFIRKLRPDRVTIHKWVNEERGLQYRETVFTWKLWPDDLHLRVVPPEAKEWASSGTSIRGADGAYFYRIPK